MVKKQSTRSIKPLAIAAVILIFLSVGAFLLFRSRQTPSNLTTTSNNVSPEDQQKSADMNSEAKKDFIENNSPQPTDAPPKNVLLTAQAGSNDDIVVLTKLTSIGNGTCELIVTNGSRQTAQTAEVIYQPEYSSCAGFTVPKSSVGSGTWTLKLTVTSGGEPTTATITHEVM